MEMKNTPKLRFPGFTDPWEQRKFGDLFEYERPDAYIVKSDNYNNDFNMPVLTANKAFILGYTNEENSYNKPSIIFDDFTLDRKYVDFPYMLKSSAIKILTSKNQHNLRFLFERLNSTRFEVLGHARHYISVVQNTTTLCPSVDEEVCISNLLTKFDELITLHQRKLEHLKLKKKSLLQKLFPKEGEVYPELRFPGFTGPWEQCKLADVANIIMGQSPSSQNYTDNPNDDILVQGNADLIDGQVVPRLWTKEITKSIDEGNIIMTVRAPVGDVAKTAYKVVLGRGVAGIKGDEYIYQFLLKLKYNHYWRSLSSGSTFESINSNDIKNLIIDIPCDEERTKIGNLLRTTDSLINLYQRKLEHLKLLKKALLQQLFV